MRTITRRLTTGLVLAVLLAGGAAAAVAERADTAPVSGPATFDGTDIPRLRSDQRITPIEDLDELIEVCSRVIEDDSLVDDVERTIDGVSRLCDQKPDDFEQRVGDKISKLETSQV